MIFSVESSVPSFKAVRFHWGLNVLLADTRPEATEKQTRNSAGKTSLVEIIHFLYGSDCDPNSLFRKKELVGHTFRGRMLLGGMEFLIERCGSDPSKIYLLEGADGRTDLPVKVEKSTGRPHVSNVNWRIFLGHVLFGLPADIRGTAFDRSFLRADFRSLFSYFARRRNSGGFISPERNAEKQQRWDWQENLSYLLGLDWHIPFEFNRVRIREKTLEELRKAAKAGAFGEIVGTVAQLRPLVAVAESRATRLRQQLTDFEVLDSYKELSQRAARAKTDMQTYSREAVSLNETVQHLEQALAVEKPPEPADLESLYTAAGIELPGIALRRFDDVSRFYSFPSSRTGGRILTMRSRSFGNASPMASRRCRSWMPSEVRSCALSQGGAPLTISLTFSASWRTPKQRPRRCVSATRRPNFWRAKRRSSQSIAGT